LISGSIRLLPKEVYLVVSFADPGHNHVGGIYQATNFYYCGMSNPSTMLIDKDGVKFHIRTIGSYKRRHPEIRDKTNKEIIQHYGWTTCESSGKHRYVFLRGEPWIKNLMYNQIKDKIQEYPKKKDLYT